MSTHQPVSKPTEYGNATSFWVEYPSGLIDLSRSRHVSDVGEVDLSPALNAETQIDIPVDKERTARTDKGSSAIVIIDMQNYFLHPDLRDHPEGLKCVDTLLKVIPALRSHGLQIIWGTQRNWGLTEHELHTIPPALVRGFTKHGRGGFGSELHGGFGRLLMRGEYNSELYGPLQEQYIKGKEMGNDVWIHKNRMSGLWGYQTALDLHLKETGTLVDAYFRGYDCIVVEDCIATTSPTGGLENVVYNAGNSYGFVTDTERILNAV